MDIIVTRSRIAGSLPLYEYRALVPLGAVSPERCAQVRPIPLPQVAGPGRCVHIAQVVAPEGWFTLEIPARTNLGCRILAVARRIEAVLVRSCFPEMTDDPVPIVCRHDADPGGACRRIAVDDLTGAFNRIEAWMPWISATRLGLADPAALRAA
jgi:hypothetical protein